MRAYAWVIRRWRPAGTPPPPGPKAWASDAACATAPGDWFPFPTDDASAEKAICAACPVRDACLAYALDAGESFGIWGGLTVEERAALVRRLTVGDVRRVA